jgi:hypothetical protein
MSLANREERMLSKIILMSYDDPELKEFEGMYALPSVSDGGASRTKGMFGSHVYPKGTTVYYTVEASSPEDAYWYFIDRQGSFESVAVDEVEKAEQVGILSSFHS